MVVGSAWGSVWPMPKMRHGRCGLLDPVLSAHPPKLRHLDGHTGHMFVCFLFMLTGHLTAVLRDSRAEVWCLSDGESLPGACALFELFSAPTLHCHPHLPFRTLMHFPQVPRDSRAEMWCSFDGKDRQELNAGDAVIIRMSQWPIPTVCSADPSQDWFMGVREGLHWNTRRVQAGAGQ